LSRAHYDQFEPEIHVPLLRLVWIEFTILALLFFAVGVSMQWSLRKYFKDFYKEFGCQLWSATVLMTVPLMFRAVLDALAHDEAWMSFW